MFKARNILFIVIIFLSLFGCKQELKDVVKRETDPDKVPTVVTRDITTLISDSGVTQYKITSKIWYIYQEAKKPYWKFPKGLFIEKFDEKFKTDASIRCDSATYFKDEQLWRLDGHVTIKNVKKELILTQQLFWDQRLQKVYSDSFIHIEKSDRIIEGYGFVSNERMTTYTLQHPMGIFPVPERAPGASVRDTSQSVINK
ncbi:MAG: LPS export ABC transporter periplasmic protein LptC [Muribaculaceae bacterium]